MKIGKVQQEDIQQDNVLETVEINPEQEYGLINRYEANLIWLCTTENETLNEETTDEVVTSTGEKEQKDEDLSFLEQDFLQLIEEASLSLKDVDHEDFSHVSFENQQLDTEKLFTSDYCFLSSSTNPLKSTVTQMSAHFFIRSILNEHMVFTVINTEKGTIALTFEDLQTVFCDLGKEINCLLKADSYVEDRDFNIFQPLLSQEYKNKFLFVNNASMRLQLTFAARDLKAFSAEAPYVLQTFMMHHDGMMLSMEPFSAPIGSFSASFLDLQNLNIFKLAASVLLVATLIKNKQEIANTAALFKSASGGEIKAFTISVQPYFCSKSAKKRNFKFSSATKIEKEEEILNIDFDILFDIKYHELLAFALENIERIFNNLKLRLCPSITIETNTLFVFKITFLNDLQQMFKLLRGNIYYVKNLRKQENDFVFYVHPSEAQEHTIGNFSPSLPPAAVASRVFQDTISRVDSFRHFLWCYTQSSEHGLLLEKCVSTNDVVPIGSSWKLLDLKNYIKQKAQDGGVLSLINRNTKIKDFLTNPLLTHIFATYISADEESLNLQVSRLEYNLGLLCSKKACTLETRFVLLDGFVTNLEAFDILLLVAFDSCDRTALMQALNTSITQSLSILNNRGFFKCFKRLVKMQTRLFYTSVELEATPERSSEVSSFSFFSKTALTTFFYNNVEQSNKEWKINLKKINDFPFNIQPRFQGIRIFKLSLCSLNDLGTALKPNNGYYKYLIFEQLKLTKNLFSNSRVKLSRKRMIEPDYVTSAKILRLDDSVVEETEEEIEDNSN